MGAAGVGAALPTVHPQWDHTSGGVVGGEKPSLE